MIEKVSEEVWLDCTNFLPEGFEKVLQRLRADHRKRLKRLGLTPFVKRPLSL